jgi:hypothetical protein
MYAVLTSISSLIAYLCLHCLYLLLHLQGVNNTRTSNSNSNTTKAYTVDDDSIASSTHSTNGATTDRKHGASKYSTTITTTHGIKDRSDSLVSVNVSADNQLMLNQIIQRPSSPTSIAMDVSFKKLLTCIKSSIDIATQVSTACAHTLIYKYNTTTGMYIRSIYTAYVMCNND